MRKGVSASDIQYLATTHDSNRACQEICKAWFPQNHCELLKWFPQYTMMIKMIQATKPDFKNIVINHSDITYFYPSHDYDLPSAINCYNPPIFRSDHPNNCIHEQWVPLSIIFDILKKSGKLGLSHNNCMESSLLEWYFHYY